MSETINVAEMTGRALNIAVMLAMNDSRYGMRWFTDNRPELPFDFAAGCEFNPAENHGQGGAIIEHAKISVSWCPMGWEATSRDQEIAVMGKTMLEAAMRCFVLMKAKAATGRNPEVPVAPEIHFGDTRFESWFSSYPGSAQGSFIKNDMRMAYTAGVNEGARLLRQQES